MSWNAVDWDNVLQCARCPTDDCPFDRILDDVCKDKSSYETGLKEAKGDQRGHTTLWAWFHTTFGDRQLWLHIGLRIG